MIYQFVDEAVAAAQRPERVEAIIADVRRSFEQQATSGVADMETQVEAQRGRAKNLLDPVPPWSA